MASFLYSAYLIGFIIIALFILLVEWTKKLYHTNFSSIYTEKEKRKLDNWKKENDIIVFNDEKRKKLKQEYDKLQDEFDLKYRRGELIYILPSTFIFLVVLCIILIKFGNKLEFDFYQYLIENELSNIFKHFLKSFIVFMINLILYSGYLIQLVIGNEEMKRRDLIISFMEYLYGPLLEEIVYRGVIFNLLRMVEYSNIQSAMISSIIFGLSHLRHFFDYQYDSNKKGMIIFQAIYTTLFGLYTSYAYSYSESLLAPILLHITCNYLQMPRLYYLKDDDVSKQQRYIISFTYIIGIILFIILLFIFH